MTGSKDQAAPRPRGELLDREGQAALPEEHRARLLSEYRRGRLLYGGVLVGVGLELALGIYIWAELRELGAAPDRSSPLWITGLAVLSLFHVVAARWAVRRLCRPTSLLQRVRAALEEAGVDGVSPPPEILTVVALRSAFVADGVAWIFLQFITVYGLVAVVMTGYLWTLVGFTALSLVALGVAAPRARRAWGLAEALHRLAPASPPA